MKLNLEPIRLNEDRTKEVFASEECQTLLQMWEDFYPKTGFNLPWIGYLVRQGELVVGSCAFTGKPIDNKVEISYWTFKQHEGKGIASWACKALIALARKSEPGVIVTAKTAPEKNASTSILERNGFVLSGIIHDHEIGEAWEWVLKS